MKKITLLLIVSFVALWSMEASASTKARDFIILRDGSVLEAKISQISAKSIIFKNFTNGVASDQYPLSDIYMVKYANRGNVYITPDGRRMTGENQYLEPEATIIYTVDCKEIQAYDVVLDIDAVTFSKKRPTKKDRYPGRYTLDSAKVFMLVYPDGTKEIFTDLSNIHAASVPQENAPVDSIAARPELKVVFYTTVMGDNLVKIAEKHGVTVDDIKKWNELSTEPTAKLRKGMQLMLYVKPV